MVDKIQADLPDTIIGQKSVDWHSLLLSSRVYLGMFSSAKGAGCFNVSGFDSTALLRGSHLVVIC